MNDTDGQCDEQCDGRRIVANHLRCQNLRFYRSGSLNESLFAEDKIHANEDGSRILAFLTKDAICKALKIELKHGGEKHGRNNNKYRRRYHRN